MKHWSLPLLLIVLVFLPQCQKNISLTKKKSLLFRTDIRSDKDTIYGNFKMLNNANIGPVDTIDENIDCYYIMWNETEQQEQVMRYNTRKDKNEVYGVIQGLKKILNYSEIFTQDKIYILGGTGERIYIFDLGTRQTTTIDIPKMDFIAGVKDSMHIITLRWNENFSREEVYNIDNMGNAEFIGYIRNLKYIFNFQVVLWDNKVHILGSSHYNIVYPQIYIFDLDFKSTQTIAAIGAYFIAGFYNGGYVILSWNQDRKIEEVYNVSIYGEKTKLGEISDLKYIINAGVTFMDDRIFILGSNSSESQRIYVFQL